MCTFVIVQGENVFIVFHTRTIKNTQRGRTVTEAKVQYTGRQLICLPYTCRAISPRSGPTAGGTVLTVNGSNLGAVVTDVIVELENVATIRRVPCDVDTTKYIPGIMA